MVCSNLAGQKVGWPQIQSQKILKICLPNPLLL